MAAGAVVVTPHNTSVSPDSWSCTCEAWGPAFGLDDARDQADAHAFAAYAAERGLVETDPRLDSPEVMSR